MIFIMESTKPQPRDGLKMPFVACQ